MADEGEWSVPQVLAALAKHGETANESKICFYPSMEVLAKQVCGSKNWASGEVFVFKTQSEKFVIFKQIAPSSCELLTITHRGLHDVLTGYRYTPEEMVTQLLAYWSSPCIA